MLSRPPTWVYGRRRWNRTSAKEQGHPVPAEAVLPGGRGGWGAVLSPHPPTQRDQDTFSESRTPNKQDQEQTTVTLRPGWTLGLGAVWAPGVTGVRRLGAGGPASLTGRPRCACRPQSAGSRGRRAARAGSWAGRALPRGTGPGKSACTCRAPTSAEAPSSPPSGS